jgi:hypothetical protein
MAAVQRTLKHVASESVNPKTGAAWRLTDPNVVTGVDSLQKTLRDPAKALQYLKEHGFVTPTGRIPKKYGG